MNEVSITLFQSGHEVESIFGLFGFKEDDISKAIAWSLKGSPHFLALLVGHLGWLGELGNVEIRLQQHEAVGKEIGRTDIELQSVGQFHIILEAKRGWHLPSKSQLEKYARRESFRQSEVSFKCLVTVSECSEEYADVHLPAIEIDGVPVRHLSWHTINRLARETRASTSRPAEKQLLKQLATYFGKIMRIQRIDSNLVYVVTLGGKTREGWDTGWIEIVEKYNRYFHIIGKKGWPNEPPAYIGFRYEGSLQSIHFIESYEVINNLTLACPGIPDEPVQPHYLYYLGPPIRPTKTVKTGKIYPSGRVWAAIDTLLTCDTVSEARDMTKERLEGTL